MEDQISALKLITYVLLHSTYMKRPIYSRLCNKKLKVSTTNHVLMKKNKMDGIKLRGILLLRVN